MAQALPTCTEFQFPVTHGSYLTGYFGTGFPYDYGQWVVKNPQINGI